VDIV